MHHQLLDIRTILRVRRVCVCVCLVFCEFFPSFFVAIVFGFVASHPFWEYTHFVAATTSIFVIKMCRSTPFFVQSPIRTKWQRNPVTIPLWMIYVLDNNNSSVINVNVHGKTIKLL